MIITKKIPFYPVLKSGNIFVRPTNTDGDSVSLREALHYGMPTVASDAVPRPEGTILFRNRDLQSMVSAIRRQNRSSIACGRKGSCKRGMTDCGPPSRPKMHCFI